MTPLPVPYFLRRCWRLLEARRALYEGAPERALGHLRDPALALSHRADLLRRRAMDVLFRDAARKASEGRDASVARLLVVAAGEDPARADEWRRRFRGEVPSRVAQSGMRELLAEMRASAGDAPAPRPRPRPAPSRARTAGAAPRPGAPLSFHLAVDDGGELLVVAGRSASFGHARTGVADVPFLADLEPLHASLALEESFHGGASWTVRPVGRGRVEVGERGGDGEGPRPVADGDVVRLSPNVAFRFLRPDPASASAVLELLHGAEAEGAQRVLLWVGGAAGRVCVGPKANRHVPVAGVEHEVELSLEPADAPAEIVVRCAGGVRVLETDSPHDPAATERRLPCPPPRRIDVVLGARPAQRAPFGLALSPLDPGAQPPTQPPTPGGGAA